MQLLRTIDTLDRFRSNHSYKKVGLVPTMGALHDGHLSLIQQAKEHCDIVIVSVFVNPTQFGPTEDFSVYPRNIDQDLDQCERAGVDAVFLPSTNMMYPNHITTEVHVPKLSSLYCGKTRPTHFKGVTSIVCRLFHLIHPQLAFFGEKDFQQLTIIKKMVQDLFMPVMIIGCPIVREQSGLALSSRNQYLSKQKQQQAAQLYQTLTLVKKAFQDGITTSKDLLDIVHSALNNTVFTLDYVAIVDETTLDPIQDTVTPGNRILIAATIEKTRLIDNLSL